MEVTVPDEGPSLPPSPFVPGGSKSLTALNQPEPAPAATSIPAAKCERVLPPELSDSDSDDEPGAKFAVGQPVEVLRSDDAWTLATVTDYDEYGLTYTIRIVDGRFKYFVEESDLRIPRFLLLSTANI